MIVVKSFVCVTTYDMATCLAMFTNISASVIFISRVEMYFHDRYKAYSEAVIGGRGADIAITKKRMFRTLAEELMSLARVQFIITLVIFSALYDLSSTGWIRRNDHEDISVSGSRIFYFVFNVRGNHFSVLFQ